MQKYLIIVIITIFFLLNISKSIAAQTFEDKKKEIIALYNSNSLEEAYDMISKITEEERDYEIWYILGNISQDLDNDTNASFFLQKSIMLKKDFDKAHYNLGNIYLKEKKYNSAINEYKLAIKYKKDFPYYYYNLGCAYLGLKEYKEAKSAFQKAIKLKSDEADFYYNLALSEKKLNNKKEAQEALNKYNRLKEEN